MNNAFYRWEIGLRVPQVLKASPEGTQSAGLSAAGIWPSDIGMDVSEFGTGGVSQSERGGGDAV